MAGDRQCDSCGFLAQRAQWQQGPVPEHREVAPEAREDPGLAIYAPTFPLWQFEADLVCYWRVAPSSRRVLSINPHSSAILVARARLCWPTACATNGASTSQGLIRATT